MIYEESRTTDLSVGTTLKRSQQRNLNRCHEKEQSDLPYVVALFLFILFVEIPENGQVTVLRYKKCFVALEGQQLNALSCCTTRCCTVLCFYNTVLSTVFFKKPLEYSPESLCNRSDGDMSQLPYPLSGNLCNYLISFPKGRLR